MGSVVGVGGAHSVTMGGEGNPSNWKLFNGFRAPHVAQHHRYLAVFFGGMTWLWIMYRFKQDWKVMFGIQHPWEHGGHEQYDLDDNQSVTFRGLADETPGCDETGDVNIIIQEKEHHFFKRKGADLLITKTVSLKQALCGYTLRFDHLDGRDVVIKTKPGEVIQSESTTGMPYTMMVLNEGMPS